MATSKFSFKKFLKENKDQSYEWIRLGHDSKGLDNETFRQSINSSLAKATARPFLTPYIGYGCVQRILALAAVQLPQTIFLDKTGGDVVFAANQFGQKSRWDICDPTAKEFGATRSQTEADDKTFHVYFCYEQEENGNYEVFAAIVNSSELKKLLRLGTDPSKGEVTKIETKND